MAPIECSANEEHPQATPLGMLLNGERKLISLQPDWSTVL